MIKDRETFFNVLPDQTAEETVKRLEHTSDLIGIEEHKVFEKGKEIIKPLYTILETGAIAARRRVSELAKRTFKRYKTEEEIERMSQLPDNKLKREGGVFIHALAQEIVEDIVYGKQKSKSRLRELARTSSYKISTTQFNNFYKEVGDVVKQIYEQQRAINRRTGEKGKVKIITEQTVIDPVFDIGGTIDLLAVFSDNTASIYDWKSMSPFAEYVTGYGSKTKIIKEFIPFGKEEAFRIQIQEYKRILKESYGVSDVRQTRVIPVHVQYKLKSKKARVGIEPGNFYTGEIALLQTGEKSSEFLKQLPVGVEKTGYNELDDFVKKQLSLVEELRSKQSQLKGDRNRWQTLQNKIQRIKNATTDIILEQNFVELYSVIDFLITDFEENSENMSLEELEELEKELNVYGGIIESTDEWIQDLSDKDKKEEIQDIIDDNVPAIQRTLARIKSRILEESVADINEEYKDSSGKLKAQAEEGFMKRMFGRLSEFSHPIFKKFSELKDNAIYKKREALKMLGQEIEDKQNALFNWGKTRGYNKTQTFDLLINKETGNLYSHLSKEFWDTYNNAIKSRDIKWLKSVYLFKNKKEWKEEYNERLNQQKAYLKAKHNNLKVWKDKAGNVLKSKQQLSKAYARDLKNWEKEWNLERYDNAWLNQRNRYHLELKEEVVENNYSSQYKLIKDNKPLLDFYEMFEKNNLIFREILGVNYRDLPPNFLPNIRREMMERMIDGGFDIAGAGREFVNSLNVREEDEFMGYRDPQTGEIEKKIPKLYLNKFLNDQHPHW